MLLTDVKTRVDAIPNFPLEAEEPVVQKLEIRRQVINVAVKGELEERSLKELGQRVRDGIAALPGISQVDLVSVRPYEVSIEVSEDALRRYGMTFDEVATAVRRSSLDLPGGSIKTSAGEILLRSKGQAYRGEEFAKLALRTTPDGSRILLEDVAKIVDGFADTDQSSRFDGKPAAMVQVFRVGDQSALSISTAVREHIAEIEPNMPEGVELEVWRDDVAILKSRIDLLVRNAVMGLLLVFLVLALFLRFKLAMWVSLGILISFAGSMALMPSLGVSVNMISLFAFILVLGIVVDDAIVTGESVYLELQEGRGGVGAAVRGTMRVAVPVTFGVLTTVTAFTPMLDVAGNARDIWMQIPLVIIPCLLFSLVESKLILPAHLRHQIPAGVDKPKPRGLRALFAPLAKAWEFVQRPFNRGLELLASKVYRPSLEFLLRWRYATLAGGLAIFVVTVSAVALGYVRFTFFPQVEGDNVVATLVMPQGTPASVTADKIKRIELAAIELGREFERSADNGASAGETSGGGKLVEHIFSSIGEQPFKTEQSQNGGRLGQRFAGAHLGEVNVQLVASESRTISAEEIASRWREKVGTIADATELTFSSALISAADDINVQLAHENLDVLRSAAERLKARIRGFEGVEDVRDNFLAGKREVKLAIKPRAEQLGLTLEDLARQVRQAFYGEEAQRIQRGRHEVKIMVRYPESGRATLADLEGMRIRTRDGAEVPFEEVAEARYGRGYATIRRSDLKRTLNVTASIDEAEGGNANLVRNTLAGSYLDRLKADYPGLEWSFEGDGREQAETMQSLGIGFLFALIVMYALMAIPFKSYLQPLIVMTAIPFGFIGAVAGHLVMNMELSIMSMLGLVALAGVVVNDSLVLVDFINRERAEGIPLVQAIRDAGARRFRPILLTSLTTSVGVLPLILEQSVQAKFMIPMAVSLAFGVMFATVITLILIPASYAVLDDCVRAFRYVFRLDTPESPTIAPPLERAAQGQSSSASTPGAINA